MMPTTLDTPPLVLPVPIPNGDDVFYEVIDGRYVEMPPMSTASVMVASQVHGELHAFAKANQLGQAASEGLFGLDPLLRFRRRPDVAFVSYDRWAKGRPYPFTDPWPVVPDLAVEVVSPSDLAEDLRCKVVDYFRYGVRLVWVIWPKAQLIDVYETPALIRILTRTDTLEGGQVLPGFRLPLGELFREAAPEGSPSDAPSPSPHA